MHTSVARAEAVAQEAHNYNVAVSSRRSVIQVCEPLVLDVAVRNDAAIVVEFHKMWKGSTQPLSFRVTAPDGGQWAYLPLVMTERALGPKLPLAPGKIYRYREILLYGGWQPGEGVKKAAYAFPEPGEYLVHAVFQHLQRRFESLPLKVTVVEATGREREALELFRGTKQAWFVEWSKRQVPEEFRRLATEYPETVYGRYARYYLATAVIEHHFDWEEAHRARAADLAGLDPTASNRRLREEVYRKTASEFADLAKAESAFPLADQCLFYLSNLKGKGEAVKVLEDLVGKYPESPVAVEARKRLEKLGKKVPAPTTQPAAP